MSQIEDFLFDCAKMIDWGYGLFPPKNIAPEQLKTCKLIAHRGSFDNKKTFENTLHSFEKAAQEKMWGLELDLRWTQDLVPVVNHDPTLKRVFKKNISIPHTTWSELRKIAPEIPSLQDVMTHFSPQLHLMIELKQEPLREPLLQNQILKEQLSPLKEGLHYHLISLQPELFDFFPSFASSTFLPIATTQVQKMVSLCLEKKYGGLCGHHLLLSQKHQEKLREQDQKCGVGFIANASLLSRELSKKREWFFTNHSHILSRYL